MNTIDLDDSEMNEDWIKEVTRKREQGIITHNTSKEVSKEEDR